MATYDHTTRYHLQSPEPSATTNVPGDIEIPLTSLDSIIATMYSGALNTTPTRPASGVFSSPSASGTTGRFYYASTPGTVSMTTGSGWISIGPIGRVNGSVTTAAPGLTATAGNSLLSAPLNHRHGGPAWTVSANLKYGSTTGGVQGTTTTVPRGGHQHPAFVPGVLYWWMGTSTPTSAVPLNGSVRLRATLPVLFSIFGTRFNTGGELTTQFRLPNVQNKTVAGSGTSYTNGDSYGAASAKITVTQLPAHLHPITDKTHRHTGTTGEENATHHHSITGGRGFTVGLGSSTSTYYLNVGLDVDHGLTSNVSFNTATNRTSIDHRHPFTTTYAKTGITSTNAQSGTTTQAISLVQPTIAFNAITGAA